MQYQGGSLSRADQLSPMRDFDGTYDCPRGLYLYVPFAGGNLPLIIKRSRRILRMPAVMETILSGEVIEYPPPFNPLMV